MNGTTHADLYEAHGPVRGSCGHEHRTLRAAQECARKDKAECRALAPAGSLTRPYSDREAREIAR